MNIEPNSQLSAEQHQRDLESVVLARLIERRADGMTEAEVVKDMTTIVNTPERISALAAAIEGLVDVSLLTRVDDVLRPTSAALRAGELELGL